MSLRLIKAPLTSDPGTLRIYTGSVNKTAGLAPSGILLVTMEFSAIALGAVSDGVLQFGPFSDCFVDMTGTAGCFTISDSTGEIILDGAVTRTGYGGELELSTDALNEGDVLRILTVNIFGEGIKSLGQPRLVDSSA